MPRYQVTITAITPGRPRRAASVEAEGPQDAINQACVQLWGAMAFWQPDSGRPHDGQVYRHRRVATPGGGFRDAGADSITVLAHLDVECHRPVEKPTCRRVRTRETGDERPAGWQGGGLTVLHDACPRCARSLWEDQTGIWCPGCAWCQQCQGQGCPQCRD